MERAVSHLHSQIVLNLDSILVYFGYCRINQKKCKKVGIMMQSSLKIADPSNHLCSPVDLFFNNLCCSLYTPIGSCRQNIVLTRQ